MCTVKIQAGPGMTRAQADFIGCLMTAAITAMPVFLQALMGCLSATPPPGDDDAYTAGDRTRCVT